MGRIHHRSVRFVDSRIKSDSKLLRYVKLHPAIYDRNHKFHRNKQEQERIWKHIASCLQKPVSMCRGRWHQLIKEYKGCQDLLTLHNVIFELVKECIRQDTVVPNSYFEDIEEDVLSKLFSESLEQPIELSISNSAELSIEGVDRDENFRAVNDNVTPQLPEHHSTDNINFSGYCYYSDSEIELMDEACSLPCYDLPFNADSFNEDNLYWSPDSVAPCDIFYNGEDIDNYYNFFIENNLNKFPMLFDDVIDSLLDHLDEEASDEARGDIVKLLCDRVRSSKLQRRQ